VVDLLLVVAQDLERDRLAERVLRTAVEGEELLPHQLEADGHHSAFFTRAGRAVARDLAELRAWEDRRVEPRRRLAFRVEPETGHELVFHRAVLSLRWHIRRF
jgi:hypothetical protein